jgi:ABC-type uncharacterized transport system fused permease/ATPase subunit
VHKYFSNHAYFALKAEGTMDNPDQRICDDVRNFVESCNSVLLAVVQKFLRWGGLRVARGEGGVITGRGVRNEIKR